MSSRYFSEEPRLQIGASLLVSFSGQYLTKYPDKKKEDDTFPSSSSLFWDYDKCYDKYL